MSEFVGIGVSKFKSDGTLKVKRGEDVELKLYFKTSSGDFDFTGYTAEMMIKQKAGDAATLTLTTANSGIELGTDSEGSFLKVVMTNTESASLSFDEGVYEIDLITGGKRKTLDFKSNIVEVISDITTAA